MNNSLLNRNLLFLKRKDPYLYERISTLKASKSYAVKNSKSGSPSLIHIDKQGNEKLIDSSYDPISEASRYLNTLSIGDSINFIVLGLGLGYQVSEIIKKSSKQIKVYIFEKDPELLTLAMQESDLSEIFEHPGVKLFVDMDPLETDKLMSSERINFTLNEYCLIKHKALVDRNTEYYSSLLDEIEKYFKESSINFKTQQVHSKLYYKNIFQNLRSLKESPGINSLKGKLQNIPALICSAGPSLDKNIQLIKSARDSFFLIAVATALKPLLYNGIKPDVVISIDPDEQSVKSFDLSVDKNNTWLVYSASVPSVIPKSFLNKRIAFDLDFYLAEWFNNHLQEKGSLGKIFSVAHSALNFAEFLDCSPVILVGQDLSFHKQRLHCLHTFYQDESMRYVSKFKPLYYFNRIKYLNFGTNLTSSEDIYGFRIISTLAMNSYNHIFSNSLNSSKLFINSTEGGVPIKGMNNISLREALYYYCKDSVMPQCDSLMNSLEIKKEHLNSLLESILILINNLEHISQKANTIKLKYPDDSKSAYKQLFVEDMKGLYEHITRYKEATLLIQNYDFSGFSNWYRSNSKILNKNKISEESTLINEKFERDYKFLDILLNSVEYLQKNLKSSISIYKS
jgi:hypothetical protein